MTEQQSNQADGAIAPKSRTRELMEHLMGTVCDCGAPKQSLMSHCRTCYYILPEYQRRALYRRIGSGYAEAYEDSLVTLHKKGRIQHGL